MAVAIPVIFYFIFVPAKNTSTLPPLTPPGSLQGDFIGGSCWVMVYRIDIFLGLARTGRLVLIWSYEQPTVEIQKKKKSQPPAEERKIAA